MPRGRILLSTVLGLFFLGALLPGNLTNSTPEPILTTSSTQQPQASNTAEPAESPTQSSEPETTSTAAEANPENTLEFLLQELAIEVEFEGGYDRDLFKHWIDDDSDGCNTRREVLILESLEPPSTYDNCQVNGLWVSKYDQEETTDPSNFDIDHMVPLSEAWDSGAYAWEPNMRTAFANDLGFEGSLIAVTASSNRSKSDKDPAHWLPANTSYHCEYAYNWMAVKYRWNLSIDQAEALALGRLVASCPAGNLTIPKRAIDQ